MAKILNLGAADAKVEDKNNTKTPKHLLTQEEEIAAEKMRHNYMGMKKQVFSKAALSEADVPFHLLIEEKIWLKEQMDIDIIDSATTVGDLSEILKFFFQKLPLVNARFSKIAPYDDIFKSGKSIKNVNTDLQTLLKSLEAQPNLRAALIREIRPVLDILRESLHPLKSFESLYETLNAK